MVARVDGARPGGSAEVVGILAHIDSVVAAVNHIAANRIVARLDAETRRDAELAAQRAIQSNLSVDGIDEEPQPVILDQVSRRAIVDGNGVARIVEHIQTLNGRTGAAGVETKQTRHAGATLDRNERRAIVTGLRGAID